MKKYKQALDILLLAGLFLITVAAIAPQSLIMPTKTQMIIVAAVLILLAAFLVFAWREQPRDERELQNLSDASRYAYIVGCVTLLIGLAIQTFAESLDVIAPITLFVMVSTKVIYQQYKDR